MKNELLSIGEAAKLKQVSVKSLRYYETIGILKPAYVDPSSGYRYYSPNQMIDLDVILTCIELGIPLKSLTDHKTNRGSLNLKELLISGRDTALANIRRAEDSLMRINSCIDEITEQEILRHKDAPYTRFLAERHIFISPWKERKFSVKSYTKAMAELYRTAEDKGYIGQSAVFGPDGVMLASGSVREELVAARIDLSAIDGVRAAMPVLEHRRPELY